MFVKVLMHDGKELFVNRILEEQKTFTVSSHPTDLAQEDLEKVKSYEPSMIFRASK
jgi:hypothetical protein